MKYVATATACIVAGLALLMMGQALLAWLAFGSVLFPLMGYAAERGVLG